ncbi:MAG: OmpA family protein [Elusimicrobia bacterium]|nr:OmpA family protein [Elusimicrobiota bacterium]
MKRTLVFLPALLAAGCVTTGKYQTQQAEAASQQKRAEAAEAKAAGLQKDLDALKLASSQATEAGQKIQLDLKSQLKSSGEQNANLQQSNKDIQQALDAKKGELTKQVADLIKERDGLKSQIVDLQSRLSSAQSEKRSLETAKQAELDKVKKNYEDLTAGLKSEIAAGQVTITQLKGKLTVNMVDKILFDSGMADVKTDGKKVLDKVGSVLSNVADKDIRIEGHTDNKPITAALQSKYPSNWELSTARATAVARYIEDTAKIDGKKLIAAGYGEFRPIASNETTEGRAQNRRIEIVLVPKE